ncbi:hypothetical protein ACJX0J_027872, partial [Zea mays]
MMKGTLEWFNATTGYGFITSIDYGEFLYFLQPPLKSHKLSGNHNLRVGDSVEFRIMEDKYGCLRAFDITAPGGGMFSGGFDDSANWNNNMDWVVDNSNDGPGCHSCNKEDVSLPVILGKEKFDSSTETPTSKVGDAESSEISQSTGHPSKVEDNQIHQVSKYSSPSDEAEPNQLRGSVGDLPEGSASSATTKIHQSGDTETGKSIHTRMEDTFDRNILQAQLAESALEPAEPKESLAIEEVLVTTISEVEKESTIFIEVVPVL